MSPIPKNDFKITVKKLNIYIRNHIFLLEQSSKNKQIICIKLKFIYLTIWIKKNNHYMYIHTLII